MNLGVVKELLEDKDISKNLHVVFVVRDPRSVLHSRWDPKIDWCSTDDCRDIDTHCEDLEEDYHNFVILKKKYPKNLHFMRFEDFAMDPVGIYEDLFYDIGLQFTNSVESFIQNHTGSVNDAKRSSTMKIAESKITTWLNSDHFSLKDAIQVQNKCPDIMKTLGYGPIHSKIDSNVTDIIKPIKYP